MVVDAVARATLVAQIVGDVGRGVWALTPRVMSCAMEWQYWAAGGPQIVGGWGVWGPVRMQPWSALVVGVLRGYSVGCGWWRIP